jgi:tetratricopeptide (TPR) repeat protein
MSPARFNSYLEKALSGTILLILMLLLSGTGLLFSQDTLSRRLSELDDKLQLAQTREERYHILMEQGELALLAGEVEKAQISYQNASFIYPRSGGMDYGALLKSAVLLFEMGELRISATQAAVIEKDAESVDYRNQARVLLERIAVLEESHDPESGIAGESLTEQYWRYNYADLTGRIEEKQAAAELILERWPQSPEAMVVRGDAARAPRFSDFIAALPRPEKEKSAEVKADPEDDSGIESSPGEARFLQAGSFTDRENAEYLIIDLNNAGFSATVQEVTIRDTIYYRVLVPIDPAAGMESFIVELKSAGFETTPVY